MSIYSDLVDQIVTDLTTTVPKLMSATVHKYAPQDASALIADESSHLAVWPVGETPSETSQIFTMSAIDVAVDLQVLYWESAIGEAERGMPDEEAAAEMLELIDDVRARFLSNANRIASGSYNTRWVNVTIGMGGAQDSSLVRWFVASIRANVPVSYTP